MANLELSTGEPDKCVAVGEGGEVRAAETFQSRQCYQRRATIFKCCQDEDGEARVPLPAVSTAPVLMSKVGGKVHVQLVAVPVSMLSAAFCTVPVPMLPPVPAVPVANPVPAAVSASDGRFLIQSR